MNADLILDAFEKIDDKYIIEAKERGFMNSGTGKSIRSLKRTFILVAAIFASLALCGFAAYEYGLFDNWLQKPSAYPIETVQSAIEGQIKKEYTLTVRIDEISVDETETKRMIERYTGSELAQSRGWTDDYLAEHFLAVRAKYYVEYDHTKTFLDDGNIDQFFYLIEDTESGVWTIIDANTYGIYPSEIAALQKDYADLWEPLSELLKKLSAVVRL